MYALASQVLSWYERVFNDGIQWAGKRHDCITTGRRLHLCINCHRFGHRMLECTNKRRCPECGLGHLAKRCKSTTPKTCISCGGPHTMRSSKCPQRIDELSKASRLLSRTEFQPQNQPDTPTDISEATESFPIPRISKKTIEYSDRLGAAVIASRPPLSTAETPMQNKRKAQSPFDRAGDGRFLHMDSKTSLRKDTPPDPLPHLPRCTTFEERLCSPIVIRSIKALDRTRICQRAGDAQPFPRGRRAAVPAWARLSRTARVAWWGPAREWMVAVVRSVVGR